MYSSLPTWIHHWARRKPDATAITFEGDRVTWNELANGVDRWAHRLREAGVVRGCRVAIAMLNRPDFLMVEWAAYRLGAIVVPINVRLSEPEASVVLGDCAPTAVVVEQHASLLPVVAAAMTGAGVWSVLDVDETPMTDELMLAPCANRSVDEPAALIYTSGTTGTPKGATLTLGNLEASASMWLSEFPLTGADKHLVISPLCFAAGFVAATKFVLASGARMVLSRTFDPEVALDLIERHRVTWMVGVPMLVKLMRESPSWDARDLSHLRGIQSGGAVVPVQLIEDLRDRGIDLSQAYGLTEDSAGPALYLPSESAAAKIGSVGLPTIGHSIRLVDPSGADVTTGDTGEIWLSGPMVFAGYWGRPDLDADSFVDGWFRTGDLAKRDDDGFYYIVGRSKEMIVTGGLNVYPAEVEAVVNRLPEISEAVVIGVPSERWGEEIVACVILRDGATLDEGRISEHLRSQLAGYKTPKRFEVFDEFPRTVSSKVKRPQLRDELVERLTGTVSC